MSTLVKVIRVPKVLSPLREEKRMDFRKGESVGDLCRRAFPDMKGAIRFSVDGKRVDRNFVPQKAELVACWKEPGFFTSAGVAAVIGMQASFATAAIATALNAVCMAVVSAALSFGMQKLMSKGMSKYDKDKNDDLSESNYGWDSNAPNSQTEGAPVPILYGRRLVAPPMLSHANVIYNDSQVMFKEVCYALSDRGAGRNDIITYPRDEKGCLIAVINSNSWINYNDENANYSPIIDGENIGLEANGRGHFTVKGTGTNSEVPASWIGDGDISNARDIPADNKVYFDFAGGMVTPSAFVVTAKRIGTALAGGGASKGGVRSTPLTNFTRVKVMGYKSGTWTLIGQSDSFPNNVLSSQKIAATTMVSCSRLRFDFVGRTSNAFVPVSEIAIYTNTNATGMSPNGLNVYVETKDADSALPISFVQNVSNEREMDKNLEIEDYIHATSAKCSPDRIGIQLTFPMGLLKLNAETGGKLNYSVKLAGRYRPVLNDGTKGAWSNFFGSDHEDNVYCLMEGDNLKITAKTDKEIFFQFFAMPRKVDNLSHYEISLKFAEAPVDDMYHTYTCNWSAIIEQWGIPWSEDESKRFVPIYPDTYVVGTRLLASERLNRNINKFQIEAERKTIYAWNPIIGKWQEKDAANPAWAAYDLIVQPRLTEGEEISVIRERYDHTKMLYSEFAEWADFCDAQGIFCAMYYDGQGTISESLEYLTVLGRAVLINKAGNVGVAIDRKWPVEDAHGNPVPAYCFDESNIVKDTLKMTVKDTSELPSVMEITYFDRMTEYKRNTVMSFDPELDREDRARIVQCATLYACTDEKVAQEYADFAIKANKVKIFAEWTGDLDSMPCEIGDLVSVKGRLFTITSSGFDGEMRRRFTAQQYVPERFL